MARCVRPLALSSLALFALAGCGLVQRAERPAWRAQAEKACLAEGRVKPSASIRELSPIDGPGLCGLEHPLKVTALKDGALPLDKAVVIDCPMVAATEDWLANVVQPAAMSRFGVAIAELDVFGGYSCRSIDNQAGEKLSEHAFANALDVSGFTLTDGRKIVIVRDWKREGTQESAFLHEAHAGACGHFTTVLGPGADVFHYNHFHLDLAMHGRTNTGARRYCKPTPDANLAPPPDRPDGLPPAPEIDEPMDVSVAKPHRPLTSFAQTPMDLHGPNFAFPSAAGTRETELAAPMLPEEEANARRASAHADAGDD